MVLGATNRPNDIDPAILRRMPKRFAIQLPDRDQRRTILDLVRSLPIPGAQFWPNLTSSMFRRCSPKLLYRRPWTLTW